MLNQKLEERVETLERQFAEFKQQMSSPAAPGDWRETFGMFRDDPEFDEILRAGREFRQRENEVPPE